MIRAIIFDCFGVIRPDKLLLTYQKLGGDIDADRQFIEDTIKAAHHGMIPRTRDVFAERLGVSVDEWMQEFGAGESNDRRLLDFIASLRGSYKTGLLTNASKGHMDEVIGQAELERCFDVVAESGVIGFAKPEAEAYGYMAEHLDIRLDECVFIDDREDYCQGARAVGMQAIRYDSFDSFRPRLDTLLQK